MLEGTNPISFEISIHIDGDWRWYCDRSMVPWNSLQCIWYTPFAGNIKALALLIQFRCLRFILTRHGVSYMQAWWDEWASFNGPSAAVQCSSAVMDLRSRSVWDWILFSPRRPSIRVTLSYIHIYSFNLTVVVYEFAAPPYGKGPHAS